MDTKQMTDAPANLFLKLDLWEAVITVVVAILGIWTGFPEGMPWFNAFLSGFIAVILAQSMSLGQFSLGLGNRKFFFFSQVFGGLGAMAGLYLGTVFLGMGALGAGLGTLVGYRLTNTQMFSRFTS